MMRAVSLLAVVSAASVLAACAGGVEPPAERGVCYVVEPGADGADPAFNVLARDQTQIEFCAARLEEMRLRFLGLGGTRRDVIGTYQGQFIFVDRAGVWFGKSLDGPRFMALARTGDGRLAVPGAIEQAPVAPAQ